MSKKQETKVARSLADIIKRETGRDVQHTSALELVRKHWTQGRGLTTEAFASELFVGRRSDVDKLRLKDGEC